ncbi:hypothetical protein ANN_19775 [Periplaneta americana]|uniref:DUF7869 domain-containing protein n=1 Tax=Periplaneta americana TaxID=6978 RepID=A0ABQ8SB17_PERAM|nr:hypothetical protein ANN_19775 [Periplaneta americana]
MQRLGNALVQRKMRRIEKEQEIESAAFKQGLTCPMLLMREVSYVVDEVSYIVGKCPMLLMREVSYVVDEVSYIVGKSPMLLMREVSYVVDEVSYIVGKCPMLLMREVSYIVDEVSYIVGKCPMLLMREVSYVVDEVSYIVGKCPMLLMRKVSYVVDEVSYIVGKCPMLLMREVSYVVDEVSYIVGKCPMLLMREVYYVVVDEVSFIVEMRNQRWKTSGWSSRSRSYAHVVDKFRRNYPDLAVPNNSTITRVIARFRECGSALLDSDERYCWFQQDSATCHTSNKTMPFLREFLVSVSFVKDYGPTFPRFDVFRFFLWGYLIERLKQRSILSGKMIRLFHLSNERETECTSDVCLGTQIPTTSGGVDTTLRPRTSKTVSHIKNDDCQDDKDPEDITDFEQSPSEYDPEKDANDSDSDSTSLSLPPDTSEEIFQPTESQKRNKTEHAKGRLIPHLGKKIKGKEIFDSYWETGCYERQRDFLCQHVTKTTVKQRRSNGSDSFRRQTTYEYKLNNLKVCKKFFLGTLNIGEKTVITAKKKEAGGPSFVTDDRRGRHIPANKTNDQAAEGVREHINLFPRVESHYCRKSSTKQFLNADLNIQKMYRLYKTWSAEKENVKENVYRRIFTTEFNLYFHRPKKDLCRICEKYNNMTPAEKDAFGIEYQRHINNKDDATKEKENDKQKAKNVSNFKSFTFDLQSVLYTPCSQVSTLYYTRKFCTYNLTIYDQETKKGSCYLWTEKDGKCGSDEIGTCLKKHVENLPADITHVSLFSDSCGGQNRNRFIASLLLHLVRTTKLEIIEHKFLETGHTDMEVDSMHSAIERAKKNVPVYTPSEWATIIKSSCIKHPYTVEILSHEDFLDLKQLQQSVTSDHLSSTSTGEHISWMDIKAIQKHVEVHQKYKAPLAITAAKLKDLLKLCADGVIPRAYRDFCLKLKGTKKDDELP